MSRPRAEEPRDRQLLLRLTARQLEMLESVAHLERSRPNAYAHQILVEHLAAMAKNPRVQADLANRAGYDANSAAATPLRERTAPRDEARQVRGRRAGRKRSTS